MPDKRYTKVEEEVLQILDRLESEKPAPSRPNLRLVESGRPQKRHGRKRSFKPSLNLGRFATGRPWIFIAGAIGLAFVAILVRDTSQNLAFAFAMASIVAFFAPIFLGRGGRGSAGPIGSSGEIRQWRGRDVSFEPPSGPSPAERLSRWFQKRRGGGPRL